MGFDLGQHLEEVRKTKALGPRVVLVLAGADRFAVARPIKLRGTTLVLAFETPKAEPGRPEPAPPQLRYLAAGPTPEAWIDVEGGGLDVIGGELYLPRPGPGDRAPGYLVRVRGGDLRLSRTRLRGPDGPTAAGFRGLALVEGSGSADPDHARSLVVSDSALLSGLDGLHLRGVGLHALLRGSLLAAGGDALNADLGDAYQGTANVHLTLERCTVAVRGAALRVPEPAYREPPAEPVVVQSIESVFEAPFEASRAGLVLGQGSAAQRGLVVWQVKGDLMDTRLHYVSASEGAVEEKPQPPEAWKRAWGTAGGRDFKALNMGGPPRLKADGWAADQLGVLQLPAGLADRRAGADLVKLRIVKKR